MKRTSKRICFLAVVSFVLICLTVLVSAQGNDVKLEPPKIVKVCNLKDGLLIKWKKSSSADGYIIYRQKQGSNGWRRLADISGGETVTYTDKNVRHNTKYTYSVKAVFKKLKSDGSLKKVSETYVAVPKIKSVDNIKSGVKITWSNKSFATEFRIYRRLPGGKWKRLKTVPGNIGLFVDRTAKSGKTYEYQLRRFVEKVGSAGEGNIFKNVFVSAPGNLEAKSGTDGIALTWNKVSECNKYQVYRRLPGESWKRIAVLKKTKTEYLDKSAPIGKNVSYKVRAVINSKYFSDYSFSVKEKRFDKNSPMVALTYDDGPYRPVTNQILDVLEKYNAKATFFVVGSRVSTYSDCVKRADSLGCEIGNHTYNHTILTSAADSVVKNEIADTDAAIKKCIGKTASIVRAPGGSVSSRVKSLVPHPLVNWSVDTMDWSHRTTSKTVQNIKDNVRDGSIVLMHDLYFSTGDASEIIIPYLIEKGYRLVTVSELMKNKGIEMLRGNLYTCA